MRAPRRGAPAPGPEAPRAGWVLFNLHRPWCSASWGLRTPARGDITWCPSGPACAAALPGDACAGWPKGWQPMLESLWRSGQWGASMHDINARHEDSGSAPSEEGAKILPLPGLQSADLRRPENPAQPSEELPDERRRRRPKPLTVAIAAGIGCLLGAALVAGGMALGRTWLAHPVAAHAVPPLSA